VSRTHHNTNLDTASLAFPTIKQKRINDDLPGYIEKAYWTQAANEVRNSEA